MIKNERKKAFLENNPSLNGRLVEEMNGDFYKGKLLIYCGQSGGLCEIPFK